MLGISNQCQTFPNFFQALFGLDAAVIASVAADAAYFDFVQTGIGGTDSYKQAWTGLKNEARKGKGTGPIAGFPSPVDVSTAPAGVLPGIEDRLRALAAQLKAHAAYTDGIGEDLGIVADEDTTTLTAPVLKVEMKGGNPVIGFNKSISDGIYLYSKRGTETAFSFLATDTRSPYVDNRPNQAPGTPETREYYAYYMQADQQVGSQSNVASVNVG